ncbi:MAG: hypothetical protein JW797_05885 [Bradymonadales bacterium]|nr:hypothetical protein [Bradymonadales bacterium]
MHISRILGLCAVVLALVGCLLPWASASIGVTDRLAGSDLKGWYPVIILAPVAVMAFFGQRKRGYGRTMAMPVAILGLAATAFMVYQSFTIEKQFFEAAIPVSQVLPIDMEDLLVVKLEIGFFLETAGSALAILAGLVGGVNR